MSNLPVSQHAAESINRLPEKFINNLFDSTVVIAILIGAAYAVGAL